MLASIIVATRNRCAALAATMQALTRVRVPAGLTTEVLVVDNGSSDDTRACVLEASRAYPAVKYLYQPVPGKSRALNTALASAAGELLVFIDDDIRPEPDWLAELTGPLASDRADAVAGAVEIAPHLLRPWMTPAHRAWLASIHELDPEQPKSAVGANMAIARHVLRQVPGFDPELGPGRLGLWEDTLFTAQLIRAGYRLSFVPSARVEHHFDPTRLSRQSFLAHARAQGRSSAYVAWHWEHAERGETSRYAFGYRLRLLAKRLLHLRACAEPEGIPTWEMDLVCGIAFADQLRLERRRPRAYARPQKRATESPALSPT